MTTNHQPAPTDKELAAIERMMEAPIARHHQAERREIAQFIGGILAFTPIALLVLYFNGWYELMRPDYSIKTWLAVHIVTVLFAATGAAWFTAVLFCITRIWPPERIAAPEDVVEHLARIHFHDAGVLQDAGRLIEKQHGALYVDDVEDLLKRERRARAELTSRIHGAQRLVERAREARGTASTHHA